MSHLLLSISPERPESNSSDQENNEFVEEEEEEKNDLSNEIKQSAETKHTNRSNEFEKINPPELFGEKLAPYGSNQPTVTIDILEKQERKPIPKWKGLDKENNVKSVQESKTNLKSLQQFTPQRNEAKKLPIKQIPAVGYSKRAKGQSEQNNILNQSKINMLIFQAKSNHLSMSILFFKISIRIKPEHPIQKILKDCNMSVNLSNIECQEHQSIKKVNESSILQDIIELDISDLINQINSKKQQLINILQNKNQQIGMIVKQKKPITPMVEVYTSKVKDKAPSSNKIDNSVERRRTPGRIVKQNVFKQQYQRLYDSQNQPTAN